jgi:diguanylate cyclase (GGDEF)-like protein/PAS domain S-box-containing protein
MLILDVVTERKRTEEALMASEEKWRLLVKAIPDYVSLHDSEGRFLFLNHYAEGFSEKDVIGSSVFQYLSPKSLDTFKMSIEKCHATGTLQTFEHTAMGDYDIMREYEDYVVPLIEKNGPPTTLLVSRDVTARKRAEEALRESQEIFSLFMHHSPIYAYIKTVTPAESRVLQASDNYIEMIGVSGADMAGKTMQELFPPEFAAKITADDWAVVTRGEVLKLDEDLNGRHYTTIKFPLTQGNKTLLAGYTIDITERKQVEEDLKQANKHLEEQLGQIKILRDYLREQATRDPLTGLYNRRYLHETMERELARAKRENYPISVLMIDIDHFKNFNDMHGHQAGDEILIALGGLLHASVRQGDIACRYGGEEFIIIMPGVHEVDAERRAEAIRNDFCKLRVNYGGVDLSATTSVGIAFFPQHGDSMNEIIKAADAALYEAKQAGRNCVRVWKKE